MKANGDYELSDVPRLLQSWRERRHIPSVLGARAALLDAVEATMANAEASCRALTPDERRAFDLHTQQIRYINSDLAEYKRERIAGLAAEGIAASECRLPF
jgi:hypothetical protein